MTADIAFQGPEDILPLQGNIDYAIKYGKVNGVCRGFIDKPVIIIDGFDPGDKRPISQIYKLNLAYENNGSRNLCDELVSDGYDVIIVNFPVRISSWKGKVFLKNGNSYQVSIPFLVDNGAGYIERNGYTVVKLLEDVRDQLFTNQSTEEIVVVGPSMGGQISRFAIKYLEDQNIYHHIRLWVSFDSPHRGANIPLGLQVLTQWLAKSLGNQDAKNTYEKQLRSPAARQMLIHQSNPNDYYNHYPDNTESYRTSWVNTLNNIGFPTRLRKVAMVNGSYSGGYFYVPCDPIFKMKGVGLMNLIDVLEARPYFMGTGLCSLLNISYVPPFQKKQKLEIMRYNYSNYGPIDASPGGLYDVQDEYYKSSSIGILQSVGFFDRTNNISFIPTPSALAMYNYNFPWVNQLSPVDVHCYNETPFDNIYIPAQNEPLTELNAENVDWIKQEIFKGSNPCAKVCVWGIDGPGNIIVNQSETYSLIGAIPSNATTVWHPGPGLSQSSATNTDVVITSNSSLTTTYLDVQIITPCQPDVRYRKHITRSLFKPSGVTENVLTKDTGFEVYPNPATEMLYIRKNGLHMSSAFVKDIQGRLLQQYTDVDQINISKLPAGIYLLELETDKGLVRRRFVKE